jgi:hypothetical protein
MNIWNVKNWLPSDTAIISQKNGVLDHTTVKISGYSYPVLWRADHSSRGVLPTVVRRRVWSRNLVNEEAMAHWGLLHQKKILDLKISYHCLLGRVKFDQRKILAGTFPFSYWLLLLPKCTKFHFEVEFEVVCILIFLFCVHICLLHSTIGG